MSQRSHVFSGFEVGQTSLSLVAATRLHQNLPAKEIVVKAPSTNTGPIAYGTFNTLTLATGFLLEPGRKSPPLYVGNLNRVWAISTTESDPVAWLVQR